MSDMEYARQSIGALALELPMEVHADVVRTFLPLMNELQGWRDRLEERRHMIQLRDDGWTIAHPLRERLDSETLFGCGLGWFAEDPGVRGVFWLNENMELGERVDG